MKIREQLSLAEDIFGRVWGAKPLMYTDLKHLMLQNDQTFFALLREEITRINNVFLRLSKRAIREHESRICRSFTSRIWNLFLRGWKWITCTNISHSARSLSHACQEYSNVNVLALRKLLQKYDKHNKIKSGTEFWNSLWKDQSGVVSFAHSPTIVQLRAIESIQALSLNQAFISTPPLPMDAQCKLSRTDLRCPICLDQLYQPIALSCGHVFCLPCLLRACCLQNSIGTPRALLSHVHPSVSCFECRQKGVFTNAKLIPELGAYIKLRSLDIWNERDKGNRDDAIEKKKRLKASRKQNSLFIKGRFYPSLLLHS